MPDLKFDFNVISLDGALTLASEIVRAIREDRASWSPEKRALMEEFEILLLRWLLDRLKARPNG